MVFPRPAERPSDNLPLEFTSFVGREREIAEVKSLLESTRLLTLTGPGGCGKTRLALRVAHDLVEGFEDGVWLVELASIADPALVPREVAGALGVHEQPDRPLIETLADSLGKERLLLVLDNCELLIDACAGLADALLRACPEPCILTTSREALGVGGKLTGQCPPSPCPRRTAYPPGRIWQATRRLASSSSGRRRCYRTSR